MVNQTAAGEQEKQMAMAKKQKRYYNDLERDGFVLVPETTGVILDGIYHNEGRQELAVRWRMQTLFFKPLENTLQNVTGDGQQPEFLS